ncbi:uncharacterized protein CC84DRAFT_1174433 [Paraphaeosphaeria sporulosa]|uniref:Uncharacterized protein n=1 Tax=Paraphaeosphaeria sporulosa TaxID=1460663 RepID=A0A177CQ44_9PLEO|nr:uncharacterized protein CC84DRAFT_1174433 [Paraphaeosphaeria sporulosa]OAG09062.1 hypothetical protein CC84DRAFT_1174433 [Paraphaeosphaeria sporulosa]
MADPPTEPGAYDDRKNDVATAARTNVGIRAVIKDSNGMLDPTPRGACIPVFERNQQQSPFLRLPGEIRNKIYGYVFETVPECFIYLMGTLRIPEWNSGCFHLSTVCRTMYKETRFLCFTNATVYLSSASFGCGVALRDIFPVQREAFSTLVISHANLHGFMARGFLRASQNYLPGLERVFLHDFWGHHAPCMAGHQFSAMQQEVGEEEAKPFREIVKEGVQVECGYWDRDAM